jgi:hypothetical protein
MVLITIVTGANLNQLISDISQKSVELPKIAPGLLVGSRCNIQYAVDPMSSEFRIIEVNARRRNLGTGETSMGEILGGCGGIQKMYQTCRVYICLYMFMYILYHVFDQQCLFIYCLYHKFAQPVYTCSHVRSQNTWAPPCLCRYILCKYLSIYLSLSLYIYKSV